jgi:hypothetical protein
MRSTILIELLQRAAQEPIGLAVETNNARAMLQHLQIMLADLKIADLMLCTPSIENTVFIIRKSVELD